jgi:hypothetical protein
MGLRLAISRIYVPQFVQKREMALLLQATAGAFQSTVPSERAFT